MNHAKDSWKENKKLAHFYWQEGTVNDSEATSPPTIAWIKYSPGSTFWFRLTKVVAGLGAFAITVIPLLKIRLPSAAVHAIKKQVVLFHVLCCLL